MEPASNGDDAERGHRVLAHAPAELTNGPLRRIGEGIGKVVYASEHWVVKRERSPREMVALIVLWRAVRKFEAWLPAWLGRGLLERPAQQLRFLRWLVQATMLVIPKSLWFTRNIRGVFRLYHRRTVRGERLAEEYLAGSHLLPQRVEFPPTRVRVKGWPGWLVVEDATERAEATLYHKLLGLANAGDYARVEEWLDRLLDVRQQGWQTGLFSTDAHLKNFGVIGDRLVLLDTGGLTNRWEEIEKRLDFEAVVTQPHIQLGLGPILGARPDLAERFNEKWKAIVNVDVVQELWPD